MKKNVQSPLFVLVLAGLLTVAVSLPPYAAPVSARVATERAGNETEGDPETYDSVRGTHTQPTDTRTTEAQKQDNSGGFWRVVIAFLLRIVSVAERTGWGHP